jgi:hypothetical protein
VDDCVIFSEASQRGADCLQEILDVYSRGLGQLVNRDKSIVFFSSNYSDEMKTVTHQGLHIEKEALTERYLGLPTAVGRSLTDAFEYIPARIRSLIGTWSGQEASCVGREVLLNQLLRQSLLTQ